jgi:hypothetical protein
MNQPEERIDTRLGLKINPNQPLMLRVETMRNLLFLLADRVAGRPGYSAIVQCCADQLMEL